MMEYLILAGAAMVCLLIILAGRWKRCVAGAVISAALLAGCATTPAGPVMSFACAPAGLPVLDATWQLVDTRIGMATQTESGRPVAMTMVALARGRQALLLTFIGEDLVLVDLNPDDPGVPLLANARFITTQVKIKTNPDGDCAWFPILEPGEQT